MIRSRSSSTSHRMSISDALFSGTQQRVLAVLFGRPDRSFYQAEVVSNVNGGSGAVQRELARLAQSELVTVRASGSQKHYQANPASPVFEELCAIVAKTVGIAEPLRSALMPLANRIDTAFVYGSVAKKQDTASSDIDLMIVSKDLSYGDLFLALEDVSSRLGRTVNPTIYTPSEIEKRLTDGDGFLNRVMEQEKIWLLGGQDDIAVRKPVRAG